MVLPAQRRRTAPGIHRQGAPGETGRVEVGVVYKRQARLEVFIDALQYLAKKGLTAAAVLANFHRQRVLPLTERRLAIFELTPEAPAEGSRMSNGLLSLDAASQRAKSAVAHLPSDPEDLWKIKMRHEEGYISLVSLVFQSLLISHCFFSFFLFLIWVVLAGTEP